MGDDTLRGKWVPHWSRGGAELNFLCRLRSLPEPFTLQLKMTSPQPTPIDHGRQQATLGVGLVVAAAIGLSAFESIAQRQLVFTGIARAVLILLVGILAFRGRRWAAWVFGFFAIAGALAGVIGLARTQFSAVGLVLFGPIVAASAIGFAMLFLGEPARAFLRRQQSLAPRRFQPPPASPPAPRAHD